MGRQLGGIALCGAGLLAGLACGSGAAPSAPNSDSGVTYQYCVTTVTEHDIDRCVFELTPAQQKKNGLSQRLTFRNGRLIRHEGINGLGVLQDDDRRIAMRDLVYQGNTLSQLTERSRNGVSRGSVRFSQQGQRVDWLDEQGRPRVYENTRATGFSRTLDAAGRVTSYTYIDAQGVPTPTPWGYQQVRFKRDSNGVIVEQSYFSAQGEPVHDRSGVHREEYLVDQSGLVVGVSYSDATLRPIANSSGVHHVLNVYDEVGNLTERAYFDLAGKSTVSSTEGAAGYRIQRDIHGSETARAYYGIDGELTWSSYGYSILETKRDARGDIIEWGAFDTAGFAAPFEPDDYTTKRVERDARGNVVRSFLFDGRGNPVLREPGYHGLEHQYDARDNEVFAVYLDMQRARTQPQSVALWRMEYDGDRFMGERYFDRAGELVDIGWGYAEKRRSFDAWGVPSVWQYFDARRRPLTEPESCPTAAEAPPKQVMSALEESLSCASKDHQGIFVMIEVGEAGMRSAAIQSPKTAEIRDCIEKKLASASIPPSSQGCRKIVIGLRFADNIVAFVPNRVLPSLVFPE